MHSRARIGHTAAASDLLSAKKAKERLCDIVEGYLFWRLTTENGKAIRRLLAKSPAGLGKTRARRLA
jgi:hypothetical protein